MRIKKNDLLPSTRWSIVYIIVIPVVVCILRAGMLINVLVNLSKHIIALLNQQRLLLQAR